MSNFYDSRSFEEKLEVGNAKEDLLVELLNLSGVPAKRRNLEEVTDVDIELTSDNMLIDSKYLETPFYSSEFYVGMKPQDCLTIKVRHVENYAQKEKNTGKKVWIAFIVDYNDFGIYQLLFVPNSYLMYQINDNKNVRDGKLHIDKSVGRDMYAFLDYLKRVRQIKENS